MSEAKIAGVCAGFARYLGLDVTLVRVLWVVLTVFPMPFFGLVSYIVAWIVMPKDPVTVPVRVPTRRTSATGSPLPPTNPGASALREACCHPAGR